MKDEIMLKFDLFYKSYKFISCENVESNPKKFKHLRGKLIFFICIISYQKRKKLLMIWKKINK